MMPFFKMSLMYNAWFNSSVVDRDIGKKSVYGCAVIYIIL